MRVRKGFECDHSTRDYGYVSGINVYYDYGTFDMTFVLPYNTELFKLLNKHGNIDAKKEFNKIKISIRLYCDDFNEDLEEYVDLALNIREEITKKNAEVIKVLDMYHEGDAKFSSVKVKSELAKRLQKVLTGC